MRPASALAAALAAAALAACSGKTGTFAVQLVTAPGSHVLDPVVRGRLVLSSPHQVVEGDRNPDGSFALDLDAIAQGGSGTLLFEGLDDAGDVVAVGTTPPLPIAAIDASIRIYVAAPQSMDAAPVALDPARTDLATASLVYGVVLAGGTDAAGAPSDDLRIYNAYTHDFQVGQALPAPRAGLTAIAGASGYAYLFGGLDDGGQPTSTFWRFDTTVAPAGAYTELQSSPGLARDGASAAAVGGDQFLVTGTPPVVLDGLSLAAAALTAPATLGGLGASVEDTTQTGAPIYAVFVGADAGTTGIQRYGLGQFSEIAGPAAALRTGHGIVATAAGQIAVAGGATGAGLADDVILINAGAGTATDTPGVLATPRTGAALAVAGSLLVIAGGTDAAGDVVPDAELVDLTTVQRVATIPLVVPRTGAVAASLPNGQVLLAGGVDATGAPVGTIELFTPAAPASF